MDAVRKMVLVSCLLAIAMSVLEMLYPSKKFDKQVRLIFSLIFMLGILTPFLTGKISLALPEMEGIANPGFTAVQNSLTEEYKTAIETNLNRTLSQWLKENQISAEEISSKVNIADDNSISISEVEVMSRNAADEAEIIRLIQNRLGQETNVVIKLEG